MTLQDCVVQRIYRLLIQMDWTMKQLSEQCGIPLAERFPSLSRNFSMHPCFSGSFCRKHHNSCYFFAHKNRQDRCISYNEKASVLPILCILVEK